MGNHVSRRTTTGKVILSDGTIHLLDQPTSVAELMFDHPQEFVLELNRGPTVPLPADHELDPAKVYLMIPMQNMKRATSLAVKAMAEEEARAVFAKTWKRTLMMMCAKIDPSDQQMVITHNNAVAVDVLKEGQEKREKEKGVELVGEERPDFLSRQFSSKGWKPNLEPIEEKAAQNKVQCRWFC